MKREKGLSSVEIKEPLLDFKTVWCFAIYTFNNFVIVPRSNRERPKRDGQVQGRRRLVLFGSGGQNTRF